MRKKFEHRFEEYKLPIYLADFISNYKTYTFNDINKDKTVTVANKIKEKCPDAKVKNSLIADGCEIFGEVENSIIFRGTKIGKGSKVKNSILFQDTYTGENVQLNCVIADKNVMIRDNKVLSGDETLPFYLAKGKMI